MLLILILTRRNTKLGTISASSYMSPHFVLNNWCMCDIVTLIRIGFYLFISILQLLIGISLVVQTCSMRPFNVIVNFIFFVLEYMCAHVFWSYFCIFYNQKMAGIEGMYPIQLFNSYYSTTLSKENEAYGSTAISLYLVYHKDHQ